MQKLLNFVRNYFMLVVIVFCSIAHGSDIQSLASNSNEHTQTFESLFENMSDIEKNEVYNSVVNEMREIYESMNDSRRARETRHCLIHGWSASEEGARFIGILQRHGSVFRRLDQIVVSTGHSSENIVEDRLRVIEMFGAVVLKGIYDFVGTANSQNWNYRNSFFHKLFYTSSSNTTNSITRTVIENICQSH